MENSRVPVEVCESIIDAFLGINVNPWDEKHLRYVALTACALTCSDWLPRSRVNLYWEVDLRTRAQFDRIVDAFQGNPELAGHVRVLAVKSGGEYLPITQLLSLNLLNKCHTFRIFINWGRYPHRYAEEHLGPLLSMHHNIVHMMYSDLSETDKAWENIVHLLQAMPRLQSLKTDFRMYFPESGAVVHWLTTATAKRQSKLHLNSLSLGSDDSFWANRPNFPLQGIFGSFANLAYLQFAFHTDPGLSDSMLECMRGMTSLETISINVNFNSPLQRTDYISDILANVPSQTLKHLELGICPWLQIVQVTQQQLESKPETEDLTYNCSRAVLLDCISGEAMQKCLQSFPYIASYSILIEDNNEACDREWWTTEITNNLPTWKDMIQVDVNIYLGENYLWVEEPVNSEQWAGGAASPSTNTDSGESAGDGDEV